MKRVICVLLIIVTICFPKNAKADAWGADIPILLEILSNTISQLYQLMELVEKTQDTLGLMRDINSGLNNALGVISLVKANSNSGLYHEWDSVELALRNIEQIYGKVPKSKLSTTQRNTDRSIAEAIRMNRELFDQAKHFDDVGERIQSHAQVASPKGAAKLTAQGLGVAIQVLNESLRAQASGLKLQAQNLAIVNSKEKEETRQFQEGTKTLSTSLKNHQTSFSTPRF